MKLAFKEIDSMLKRKISNISHKYMSTVNTVYFFCNPEYVFKKLFIQKAIMKYHALYFVYSFFIYYMYIVHILYRNESVV